MTRKTSLEKVVERNREHYGIDLKIESLESPLQKSSETKLEPSLPQSEEKNCVTNNSKIQEYELKLRM